MRDRSGTQPEPRLAYLTEHCPFSSTLEEGLSQGYGTVTSQVALSQQFPSNFAFYSPLYMDRNSSQHGQLSFHFFQQPVSSMVFSRYEEKEVSQ